VRVIVLSERANADMDRLRLFLAKKSLRAARDATLRIVQGIDLLLTFPEIGVPLRGGIRQHYLKFRRRAYIVRYRIVGEEIRILRIWHSLERRPRGRR